MNGLIVLIAVAFVLCPLSVSAQMPTNRSEGLKILKGCATRPTTLNCNEDTADYLVKLYNRGDRSLFRPLLDAGLTSDGALSELLGDFYSEVLSTKPRMFLRSLRSRPKKQQKFFCSMAGSTDGSGMNDTTLRRTRSSLRALSSHNDDLAAIAKVCLIEVDRANAGH